jgi:hypothetical protein
VVNPWQSEPHRCAVNTRPVGVRDEDRALRRGQHRYAEAAARFREANAAVAGAPYWLPELALAFERQGRMDSALAVYERYLTGSYNYRTLFRRGPPGAGAQANG